MRKKKETAEEGPEKTAGQDGIPRRAFIKGLIAAGVIATLPNVNSAQESSNANQKTDGRNLYQKIISSRIKSGQMVPGKEIGIEVDHTLTHDLLGVMSYLQFEAMGIPRVRTKLSVSYVDHNLLQDGFENADDHRYLESVADKYGILYSKAGNGICHQVHVERFARPGWVLAGGDSHTPSSGAVGMLAMGAGGLDIAAAMGGGLFYMTYPKIIRINLNGEIADWASAKDVILEVLKQLTTKGNVGWAIEYGGTGLPFLTVPERQTIANMGAEAGVTTSIFPSDDVVRQFMKAQAREDQWVELKPDAGASYDRVININLSALEPSVAFPHSPENVKIVRLAGGIKVDQVLIGSCTNSSYRDLMVVATMLKGRKIHPSVSFGVVPGSRQVYTAIASNGALSDMVNAGARILESGCSFCNGSGQAPQSKGITVRTSNRNYVGRSATLDAEAYLVSPETAVATALTGKLTDPRELGLSYPKVQIPKKFPVDDSMIIKPTGKAEIRRGPNIGAPPINTAMPSSLKAKVAVKVGDKITTDHITPGGSINKYRSNIPKYAEYVFRDVSPKFAERCKANQKQGFASVIVAGLSYGQGSSREHAALCPMYLGVRVVMAHSIERIHMANLINFGIVPLVFTKAADYESIREGDELTIDDIAAELRKGAKTITAKNITQGKVYSLKIDLTERQRNIVQRGGLLNYIRETIKA
jgi:aconitate hydratase